MSKNTYIRINAIESQDIDKELNKIALTLLKYNNNMTLHQKQEFYKKVVACACAVYKIPHLYFRFEDDLFDNEGLQGMSFGKKISLALDYMKIADDVQGFIEMVCTIFHECAHTQDATQNIRDYRKFVNENGNEASISYVAMLNDFITAIPNTNLQNYGHEFKYAHYYKTPCEIYARQNEYKYMQNIHERMKKLLAENPNLKKNKVCAKNLREVQRYLSNLQQSEMDADELLEYITHSPKLNKFKTIWDNTLLFYTVSGFDEIRDLSGEEDECFFGEGFALSSNVESLYSQTNIDLLYLHFLNRYLEQPIPVYAETLGKIIALPKNKKSKEQFETAFELVSNQTQKSLKTLQKAFLKNSDLLEYLPNDVVNLTYRKYRTKLKLSQNLSKNQPKFSQNNQEK